MIASEPLKCSEKSTFSMCRFSRDAVISDEDTRISSDENPYVKYLLHDRSPGIEYLPIDIVEVFPNIKDIHAIDCSLKALYKKNFRGLVKIDGLLFDKNQISYIEEDAFDDLVNLRLIFLANNRLKTWSLPENVFSKVTNLTSVLMNNNNFDSLDRNLFKNNLKLKHLILSENNLKSIPSDIFLFNVNLKLLSLDNNQLEELPFTLLSNTISLDHANFSSNPLNGVVDFSIFENTKNISKIDFSGIQFSKILNIEVVDNFKSLKEILLLSDNSCINGNFTVETLENLKENVKENCQ